MARPLAIELFCGMFGWSSGWLALGGQAIGFDLEHLPHHGDIPIGAELVIQDVLTLHGSQFRNASIIMASPPCTQFSYRAMPWKRSKVLMPEVEPEWWSLTEKQMSPAQLKEWNQYKIDYPLPLPSLALYDACFRIQREASEAAGRQIPMIVENVRGIQKYVGPAPANFGSFFLYGDVGMVGNRIVAGMPKFGKTVKPFKASKNKGGSWFAIANNTDSGHSKNPVQFEGQKNTGGSWFRIDGSNQVRERGNDPRDAHMNDGGQKRIPIAMHYRDYKESIKQGDDWFNAESGGISWTTGSKSPARKAASAHIAKIPFPLSLYVAESFWPL